MLKIRRVTVERKREVTKFQCATLYSLSQNGFPINGAFFRRVRVFRGDARHHQVHEGQSVFLDWEAHSHSREMLHCRRGKWLRRHREVQKMGLFFRRNREDAEGRDHRRGKSTLFFFTSTHFHFRSNVEEKKNCRDSKK